MAKNKKIKNKGFPNKLFVSGYPIQIKLVSKIPEEYNMSKNTIGLADSTNRIIYILKQKSNVQNYNILFHELIHLIYDLLYVKIKERDVHAFAFALIPVLAQLEKVISFEDLI